MALARSSWRTVTGGVRRLGIGPGKCRVEPAPSTCGNAAKTGREHPLVGSPNCVRIEGEDRPGAALEAESAEDRHVEAWDVDIVDDMSNGHREFVPHGANLIVQDFASELILDKVRAKSYDFVFHLAAIPRVSYSVEHPLETHETNVN